MSNTSEERFYEPDFYDNLKHLSDHLDDIAGVAVSVFTNLFGIIVVILLSVGSLLYISPLAALFILSWIAVSTFIEQKIATGREHLDKSHERVKRKTDYYLGLLTGRETAREIRVLDIVSFIRDKWEESAATFILARTGFEKKSNRLNFISEGFRAVLMVLITALLFREITAGSLSLGEYIYSSGIMWMLMAFIYQASHVINNELKEKSIYARLYDQYVDSGSGASARTDSDKKEKHVEPETIAVSHVSFRYPGSASDALNDVSLTIRRGRESVFLGRTEAGKRRCHGSSADSLRLLQGKY